MFKKTALLSLLLTVFAHAPHVAAQEVPALDVSEARAMIAAAKAANAANAGQPAPATATAPASVVAATAPAGVADLPPPRLVSPAVVPLTPKEREAARLAAEWKNRPDLPRRGEDGSVRFLYGATLPSVVCAPLQVCAISLQPGEVVRDVHVGDSVRWKVVPSTSGTAPAEVTNVVVKPTDAGLSTNLLLTTDRRIYTIKLVSTQAEWMPIVSFAYADDVQAAWATYNLARSRQVEATTLPTGQDLSKLDFGFHISGDAAPWKPLRVYSDGTKTYLQFPAAMQSSEAPALVSLANDGSEQLVNYRVVGDRYIVDKVLTRAALISGVGRDQLKVKITRTAER